MDYEIGSYHWYVNAAKDSSYTFKEWREYCFEMVKERIKKFELKKGQKVKILVGGGKKEMWYTGTIEHIGFNLLDGVIIKLKQTKTERFISGWQVIDIVKL